MQGRLAALVVLALVVVPTAMAQAQICRVGSVEYQCGWTAQPSPEEELAWYERGDVQFAMGAIGILGSVAAGGYAFLRTRQRRQSLVDLLHAADSTYAGAKHAPDEGIPKLVTLRSEVRERHARGRIEDAQYLQLDQRITDYIVRLRLLEVDRRFGALPAAFLSEVRRLVADGSISKAESDLVSMHAGAYHVPEPQRSQLVALVRSWASEDAGPVRPEPAPKAS